MLLKCVYLSFEALRGQISKSYASKFIYSSRGTRWNRFWAMICKYKSAKNKNVRKFSRNMHGWKLSLPGWKSSFKNMSIVFLSARGWILMSYFWKSDREKLMRLGGRKYKGRSGRSKHGKVIGSKLPHFEFKSAFKNISIVFLSPSWSFYMYNF